MRHFVHALRDRLEPERTRRSPSSFIHSSNGTYSLDGRIELDVTEFGALAGNGLEGPTRTGEERQIAIRCLERAIDLYRGDLFAEEPFAEWAFAERERLRALLHEAVLQLAALRREDGEPAAATRYLERQVDLWPTDEAIQRALIELYLEQGRHSDAQRRHDAYRRRLRIEFAREANFDLADLDGPTV